MSFFRSLFLPAMIATPLWLFLGSVTLSGGPALVDLDLSLSDLFFGFVLTIMGLLLVGLPAASFVGRWGVSAPAKAASLCTAGAVGGASIAAVYACLIGLVSGGQPWRFLPEIVALALRAGFIPGTVVALIWIFINYRDLKPSSRPHLAATQGEAFIGGNLG